MRKKKVKFFNEFSKMELSKSKLSKDSSLYQTRFGLAYPVPSFQERLASANAANVVTINDNEKQTANQTEKNSTTSESSGDVQTAKSRMKWNYGQTTTLIHFWKNNIQFLESPISINIWAEIKLKTHKQRPGKTTTKFKANLRTLRYAYKKAKDNWDSTYHMLFLQ